MIHAGASLRHRTREKRVEEILSTALSMVDDEGLETLTVQKLAQRLDWAVGALYRYYPGKDALFAALQMRVLTEYGESLRAALAAAYPEPTSEATASLEPLAFIAEHYRAYAAAHPTRFRMISLSLGEPRELLADDQAKTVMQGGLSLLTTASAVVAHAADVGALAAGAPLPRTLLLWSTLQGVLLMRKLQRLAPRIIDVDALYADAVATLLCGWGAESEQARRAMVAARAKLSLKGADHG